MRDRLRAHNMHSNRPFEVCVRACIDSVLNQGLRPCQSHVPSPSQANTQTKIARPLGAARSAAAVEVSKHTCTLMAGHHSTTQALAPDSTRFLAIWAATSNLQARF